MPEVETGFLADLQRLGDFSRFIEWDAQVDGVAVEDAREAVAAICGEKDPDAHLCVGKFATLAIMRRGTNVKQMLKIRCERQTVSCFLIIERV